MPSCPRPRRGLVAGERIALEYDFRGPPRPRRTDGATGASWKSGPSSFGGGSIDVLAGGAKGANSLLARLDRSCVSFPHFALSCPWHRRMLTFAASPCCSMLTGKSPCRRRAATTRAATVQDSSRPSDAQRAPAPARTQPLSADAVRLGLLHVALSRAAAGAVGGTGTAVAAGAVRAKDRAASGPQRRQRTSTGSSTISWRRAMPPAAVPLLLVQRMSIWLDGDTLVWCTDIGETRMISMAVMHAARRGEDTATWMTLL